MIGPAARHGAARANWPVPSRSSTWSKSLTLRFYGYRYVKQPSIPRNLRNHPSPAREHSAYSSIDLVYVQSQFMHSPPARCTPSSDACARILGLRHLTIRPRSRRREAEKCKNCGYVAREN